MRRLVQIVMVVALLLSGPMLPASMMPCCMDDGMRVKAATSVSAASSDDSMDMAVCHHEAMGAAHFMTSAQPPSAVDCVCAFRSGTQTATYDVSEQHEGAAFHATLDTVIAVPPVVTNAALSDPPPHPPSPLTATPLPLRV